MGLHLGREMDLFHEDLAAEHPRDVEHIGQPLVESQVDAVGVAGGGEAGVGDQRDVLVAHGGHRPRQLGVQDPSGSHRPHSISASAASTSSRWW